MTRAEKVAEAQRLRAEGLKVREIAAKMGTKRGTVQTWLNDPDLSRQRANRERYRGSCKGCGAPTDGSNGPEQAAKYCHGCAGRAYAKWTKETIVAAIHRFEERHGRPPAAPDFNPGFARKLGHGWRAERFYTDGDYPNVHSVQCVFGTWNAGLAAAGFPTHGPGAYPRIDGRYVKRGAHLEDERQAA